MRLRKKEEEKKEKLQKEDMLSFQVGYMCVLGLIIHRFFMKMHTVRFYLLTILQSKVPLPSYL